MAKSCGGKVTAPIDSMTNTIQRAMTDEERAALEASVQDIGTEFWSQTLGSFVVATGVMTAVLYVGWSLLSWLLRATLLIAGKSPVFAWESFDGLLDDPFLAAPARATAVAPNQPAWIGAI